MNFFRLFTTFEPKKVVPSSRVILNIPAYTVIYIKSSSRTPLKTRITFRFPNGENVNYDCDNVLLTDFTKEQLIDNKLFPYIPFYITRYEKEIMHNGNIETVLLDLEYFRDELAKLYKNNELSSEELLDIMSYINRIIMHITDGNEFSSSISLI